jgi:hypothetical protein
MLAPLEFSVLGQQRCSVLAVLLVAAASIYGCEESTPPVTDAAQAPWLLDPQSQINSLKNSDYRIRGLAALNLGKMGAKASDAIPELERLVRDDPNERVRMNASEALEKIRGATIRPN